jgi:hypothetical protein
MAAETARAEAEVSFQHTINVPSLSIEQVGGIRRRGRPLSKSNFSKRLAGSPSDVSVRAIT